ncbi:type VI secretion system PAAR protein [Vibrio penaeicida]|uniref:type VI secretion system PAAR protein n=1 Tax=Vibrio penaeicida TaxID=104609 RepID=UPI000CEA0BE1|nr:type VI secretion system PAAR protein [Vibrio penaeicida]
MGNAVVLGNIGTAHDGFPPTPVCGASPDVKADGIPIARVGDPLVPHAKPKHPPHGRSIAAGSGTVFVNGKPVARSGDAVSCGGSVVGGGTVTIG